MSEPDSTPGAPLPSISEALFRVEDPVNVYAVVDGAKVPLLLDVLEEHEFEGSCLLPGRLEPDVAAVAPYVVQLEPGSRLTEWLLGDYWDADALIVLRAELGPGPVVKHLRGLTVAKLPDGARAYFRFYDPRVLRAYLPTCTEEEQAVFFGEVAQSFWVDAGTEAASAVALEFVPDDGAEPRRHPVASAAG